MEFVFSINDLAVIAFSVAGMSAAATWAVTKLLFENRIASLEAIIKNKGYGFSKLPAQPERPNKLKCVTKRLWNPKSNGLGSPRIPGPNCDICDEEMRFDNTYDSEMYFECKHCSGSYKKLPQAEWIESYKKSK